LLQQLQAHGEQIRLARERALRDERLVALGTQAAQVAHQLGTPLNTLMLLAEELRQPLPEPDRQAVLKDMEQQLAQCRNWLLSLREIGQQEAGMPLGKLIADTLEQWRWYRPQAELDTDKVELTDLDMIVPSSLAPALLNLFNNAYEASQRNGSQQVRIETRRQHDQLIVAIHDDGSGFDHDRRSTGLGIGIHLANASIERLGGSVSWQPLPGGGTRTDVVLPLTEFGK
jgi:two-component system sensor histidine kinase RegB